MVVTLQISVGRRAVTLLAALAALLCFAATARAEPPPDRPNPDPEATLQAQLRALDARELEQALGEIDRTYGDEAPTLSLRHAFAVYKSGGAWEPKKLLIGFGHYFLRALTGNAALLGKLIVLGVLMALLQQLSLAFGGEGAGQAAHLAVYLVLMGLTVSGFGLALGAAKGAVDKLVGFMLAALPPLLAALAALGSPTSAAIFHPLMAAVVGATAFLVKAVVFPLLFIASVLDVVSGLNDKFRLTGLAGLLKQGALTLLGLSFTAFLGIIGLKGAAGAVADGVALRSAKFLTAAFVPVIGKLFSDAADLMLGSGLLLKNAIGAVGAMAIVAIAVFPLLQIAAIIVVYRLAAAVLQPMGGGPVAACLGAMAGNLNLLWATVAVVALLFLLSVTAIMAAGNLPQMLR